MRSLLKSSIKLACLLASRACRIAGLMKVQAPNGFTSRRSLLGGLQAAGSVLEIGPFDQPVMRGANVKYFDVIDQQGLMARAQACGRNANGCPHIDYVSSRGDLDVVTEERFDNVVSSHCLEHQPNLIRHLDQVFDILKPGGRYYVIVPDKRFTFDYYIPLSRVSDVLAAHTEMRDVHTLTSIFYHYAETTHNRAMRHWLGLHRSFRTSSPYIERLRAALAVIRERDGDYIDVHCWCFTPASFLRVLRTLAEMRMVRLNVEKVYGTVIGTSEFFGVLQKPPTTDILQRPQYEDRSRPLP